MERYFKFYNSLLWGVVAIIFGVLLIKWQRDFLQTIVLIMGIVALVVAVVQFVGFLMITKGQKGRWTMMPASPFFALIIGILLLLSPLLWVDILMRVVGVVIVLLSVSQIVALMRAQKGGFEVKGGYYIFPSMMILAGIMVLVEPLFAVDWLVIFAGCWFIGFGIMELFSYFGIKKIDEKK